MEGGGWDSLSISSQNALKFAWAAARVRTGFNPPSAEVDPWDLLVGIVLSHPGYSEAELAFRHFGLVVGQALPDDYPRLSVEELNAHLSAMSPSESPPLTREAQAIVEKAAASGVPASRADVAELRSLWAALLEVSSETSSRIHALLTQRGVNVSGLVNETRTWVEQGGQPSYDQILAGFQAAPIDVINYKADQAYRGDEALNLPADDFVGISAEVDAFAYLIAARSLEPPLAIGLFGDWGSGKSYFLSAIQRRIDQLIESDEIRSKPQRDIPFWKRIVQVDFNAWHYVEGDLWSSLVDHIFTQLNLASEKITDNAVETRQRYYLRQLETTSESLKRLEEEEKKVKCELKRREGRIRELEESRDKALQKLREAQAEKFVAREIQSSKNAVVNALTSVWPEWQSENLNFKEALDSLSSARADVERGRSLLRPILDDRRLALKLLGVLILTALILFGIERLAESGVAAGFVGLASFLAVAVKVLQRGSQWITERVGEIDAATQAVNQELEDAEAEWRERLENAEQQVRDTRDQLDALKREETQLNVQLGMIQQALDKRPPEILYDFLRERLEAGEYRKRLGVPAIIRRDFKGLADLVSYQNAYLLASDETQERIREETDQELLKEDDKRIINRIVLYIDDLDRCPDAKVIEVLQAVHLLLAFPLFVVVVAVDSRWLAHALQSRFPVLAGGTSMNGKTSAQPDDYLEKIFQVPFWVQELNNESRSRIVHGLLGSHVRGQPSDGASEASGQVRVGEDEAKVLREMIEPRSGPPLLDAAALTVTRDELAFLDRLTPLMGHTPRSVKRFVNVYQLVKIVRRGRTSNAGGYPSDDELAAFLLAVAEGLPSVGLQLLEKAGHCPGKKLIEILNDPGFASHRAEHDCLKLWLEDYRNAALKEVPDDRLGAVASDVRRFVFRVMPDAESSMGTARPQLVHVIQQGKI